MIKKLSFFITIILLAISNPTHIVAKFDFNVFNFNPNENIKMILMSFLDSLNQENNFNEEKEHIFLSAEINEILQKEFLNLTEQKSELNTKIENEFLNLTEQKSELDLLKKQAQDILKRNLENKEQLDKLIQTQTLKQEVIVPIMILLGLGIIAYFINKQ